MKKAQWIAGGSAGLLVIALLITALILRDGGNGETAPQQGHVHGAQQAAPPESAPDSSPEAAPLEEEEAPAVEISEDMQRAMGVKTAAAAFSPLTKTIRLTGRIGYDEGNISTVNTKVEGWIEKLHVEFEGTYIRKGEPVAGIYSPELMAAQQELISLSSSKGTGGASPLDPMVASDWERLIEAARKRLRLWDISEAQIRRLEKTGEPMRTLTILSPVSGYVVKRYATRGMRVMPGEPLLDVVNLSKVWVIAEVSEPDADVVRVGMPVEITVTGLPGRIFHEKIDYVYPTMDAETRTLRVRTTLPNPDDLLKPQMYATVEIRADLGRKLLVPEDAVIDTGLRQVVYVDRGEGYFEPRLVKAGLRSDGMREIISGLRPGERVATSALFLIDSEAQLKGIAPAPPGTTQQEQAPAHPGHQH
ncbi:MAG TPA: efflux RND transporter periplasmic adaptor subunit [Deltaproteobacteria bacterium]|jgi:Cu(I)/Ag(I) efflux system membrane fusion protein|nr:efflux RND transporter periplasmic adaptor subunit [Deltaproteobacteria bacterium]HOI05560.1 efflux RND transporter periplasmic adaptor subunit [Deltaproteobacteria bacterium]